MLDRALVSPWAIGLDTGCVHGRTVTAVFLPEAGPVAVPARRAGWPPRAGGVAADPVLGGVRRLL
ncbi:MAG: hypothetical protein HZA54_18430 [Planctomycetes bacterium]|nr:hypothetical protein [Planctomycetota bacterium]